MKESDRGRVVAGRYELQSLLGEGGMGEVWVAKAVSTGHEIALKLLKGSASESKEHRARFEREARIASTLLSPHLVQVTDSGVDDDGTPFMAMELLHGEDLSRRIKTQKRLPVDYVVRLAIEVGRALHVAHSAGLVHRDLKPANIFLARQGNDEIAKVLDFGVAKGGQLESTEFTTAGSMLGTASYMSPEQIRNAKTVDHRADLWAFAVVLYRALTGALPFPQTGFDLFLALTQDPLPAPKQITALVPDLPRPLNVFFERSFVKELDKRYANASAMVVGFCRAAGVTVPPDILQAAVAPPSGPLAGIGGRGITVPPGSAGAAQMSASGSWGAQTPPSGNTGPRMTASGSWAAQTPPSGNTGPQMAASGAWGTQTPPSGSTGPQKTASGSWPAQTPPSPNTGPQMSASGGWSAQPAPAAPAAPNPPVSPLSGTLMLDPPSLPNLGDRGRSPSPAAGRAPDMSAQTPHLDPAEPDNASTLFLQPGLSQLAASIAQSASASATPGTPPAQTPPGAQAQPGAQPPATTTGTQDAWSWQAAAPPVKPSRAWIWVVVLVLLVIGAGAAVYFLLLLKR